MSIMSSIIIMMISIASTRTGDGSGAGGLVLRKVVEVLKIEPEAGTGAEGVGELDSHFHCNGVAAVENISDVGGRYLETPRQFGGAHAVLFQFTRQVLARMDISFSHNAPRPYHGLARLSGASSPCDERR